MAIEHLRFLRTAMWDFFRQRRKKSIAMFDDRRAKTALMGSQLFGRPPGSQTWRYPRTPGDKFPSHQVYPLSGEIGISIPIPQCPMAKPRQLGHHEPTNLLFTKLDAALTIFFHGQILILMFESGCQ